MLGVNRFPIFQYSRRRPVCFLIEVFLPRETLYFQNGAPAARSRVGRRRGVRNRELHDEGGRGQMGWGWTGTNRERLFVRSPIVGNVKSPELIKRGRAREVTRLCIGAEMEDECAPSPRPMPSGFRSKSRHLVRPALYGSRNSRGATAAKWNTKFVPPLSILPLWSLYLKIQRHRLSCRLSCRDKQFYQIILILLF